MKDEAKRIVEELFGLGDEEAQAVLREAGVEVPETSEPKEDVSAAGTETSAVATEEIDLEPVVAKPKEEEKEPDEKPPAERPKVDPVIEVLKGMTPEERAAWAAKGGPDAVLKLMEFQQMMIDAKIEGVAFEQKRALLDTVVQKWAKQNSEILEDPLMSSLAEGIDMSLLKKAGYSSYLELTPAQLEDHLNQVGELLAKIRKVGVSAELLKKDVGGEKEKETEDVKKPEEKRPVHIGDLGPGGGGADVTTEALERLAEDPVKFEQAIQNISEQKLAEMLAGIP